MAASQAQSVNIVPGVSQNMASKIGRNAAELAKPCFTAGMSRVSRSRAAKALGLRNKRNPVSPQSPPSPNQETAVNSRTGKVAFGPWQGPYETNTNSVASAAGPLFMDPNGNTYAFLHAPTSLAHKGIPAPPPLHPIEAQRKVQQPHVVRNGTKDPAVKAAPAASTTQQLYAMVNKVAQRNSAAQRRAPSQWLSRGKPHGSGRCSSSMGRNINQPRRA